MREQANKRVYTFAYIHIYIHIYIYIHTHIHCCIYMRKYHSNQPRHMDSLACIHMHTDVGHPVHISVHVCVCVILVHVCLCVHDVYARRCNTRVVMRAQGCWQRDVCMLMFATHQVSWMAEVWQQHGIASCHRISLTHAHTHMHTHAYTWEWYAYKQVAAHVYKAHACHVWGRAGSCACRIC